MELVDYNESIDPGERLSEFTSQHGYYSLCDFGLVNEPLSVSVS